MNLYAYCNNDPVNYVDNFGRFPQRIGDWLIVDKALKYRFDDITDIDNEHIHVILDHKKYSWYRKGHKTRHGTKNGLNDLSRSAQKRLKKNGVPNDYFNSIILQPKNILDSYTIFPYLNKNYDIEAFPYIFKGSSFEIFPVTKINNEVEQVIMPIENNLGILPYPINKEEIPSFVFSIGLIAIAVVLATYTGGASLILV